MKPTFYSLFAILALVPFALAACNCSPSDTACLANCVQTANSCIQNCQGDTTCYSNCIQQNWPTSIAPTASGVTMLPTASVTGTGTGLTSITATVPTTSQTTHTGTASATQTATSDALPNDPMTAFCSLLLAITLAMLIA